MKLRAQLGYDTEKASLESGLECKDPSLTQQHEVDSADINSIVARFGLGGLAPQVIDPPTYGDFDQVNDFRTALEIVNKAKASFMELPAHVRARFSHDPGEFLAFVEDPANGEALYDLGLRVRADLEPPQAPPSGDPA